VIDFEFRPESYFDETGPTALIAKLTYPESQWGEEICLFAAALDGNIIFEVADFYGNEYKIQPDSSERPLTLQEVIVMIESLEVDPEAVMGNINQTLLGIPEAESNLYKNLKDYFAEKRIHFGY
jgi:hypothetical protein